MATTLKTPLSQRDRIFVLETVWDRSPNDSRREEVALSTYFARYDTLCLHRLSMLDDWSHENIATLAKDMLSLTKDACAKQLAAIAQPATPTEQETSQILDFVARLIFCLDLVGWEPSQTLQAHLHSMFPRSTQDDRYRIPRSFNLCTIAHITDINITWTVDLNRHLQVTEDNGDIAVFHCVTVLDLFRSSANAKQLFPAGLIDETIKSLSLMCPGENQQVKTWLRKEQRRCNEELDPRLISLHARHKLGVAGRKIDQFDFWRDQLIIVKEVFDDREPRNILHLWRDYRKPSQWWTFWIALTAFLLSLIACIEGAMQVYKAYHPS
ncbi:uncharacterized protein HMPREF1541_02713 [Cyphellophora europaea CBS 101466]|uniref:Uncharacterized protein n=1 Tax=Cyphellophora europaea (strain CBS 101466) TaxID=1220924 RepID=W2S6J9_CYPE1|nr:uncharacterized protein HMPREF1541_02713 [Cyphellophora europaea CBS 101466]ETN43554.1 hypothetical protein HMPREF1541_02713 [Cyphellophora europaea CBS 101466]